jgi:hypothetical protein
LCTRLREAGRGLGGGRERRWGEKRAGGDCDCVVKACG